MSAWSKVCALERDGAAFTAQLPASWGQGRTGFGGLVAGLGLRALAGQVPADRLLRSVLVDFVGPVAPGPLQVQAEVLRQGRSLTQAEARVTQEGQLCAVILAAFGASRRTRMPPLTPGPAPAAPGPDDLVDFPFIEGITPSFTRFFDYRWAGHHVPFSGSDQAHVDGWVRFKDTAAVDAVGLLGLIDAWPAPVLALLGRPAMASTVTWMVDIVGHLPPQGVAPDQWWRFEARGVAAADGYADVEGRLWGPDGRLVAVSRQLVVEFS